MNQINAGIKFVDKRCESSGVSIFIYVDSRVNVEKWNFMAFLFTNNGQIVMYKYSSATQCWMFFYTSFRYTVHVLPIFL